MYLYLLTADLTTSVEPPSVAIPLLSSLYHTCLICLCWAVIRKEMNKNILHFKKENVISLPLPLCAIWS